MKLYAPVASILVLATNIAAFAPSGFKTRASLLALSDEEFAREFVSDDDFMLKTALDLGLPDGCKSAQDGRFLQGGMDRFLDIERRLEETKEKRGLHELNIRVRRLPDFVQEDLFANCKTTEEKLEKLEKMKAYLSLDERERMDVMEDTKEILKKVGERM
mmetsp:Transcript_19371/g.42064  ORF Transcript_19371/g.42064 Transcript_19371/m.42064 type:complete len:160 (-) Transcript_19371:121-600(-)|eukprot:CAMPEP_0172298080 /NCGR_PEP_ID=MMETSP1058-20130122/886_1 /TAXON_ID=83371 /ORGANISM="Detonula confervacea, Strain CCMP 353" /LENGTH=159 /DNA_ID=CAMNT_0013007319 /DNA_START=210 /DNA_END=689 /DNA_ORIENTATION=-